MTPREQYPTFDEATNPQGQEAVFTREHLRALQHELRDATEAPFTARDARNLKSLLEPAVVTDLDEVFDDIERLMAQQAETEGGMYQPLAGKRPSDLLAEQTKVKQAWAASLVPELLEDLKAKPVLYNNLVKNPKASGKRSPYEIFDGIIDATGLKLPASDLNYLAEYFVENVAAYVKQPEATPKASKPVTPQEVALTVIPETVTEQPTTPRHATNKSRTASINKIAGSLIEKTKAVVAKDDKKALTVVPEKGQALDSNVIVAFTKDGPEVGPTNGRYKGEAIVSIPKFTAAALILPSMMSALPSPANFIHEDVATKPTPASATADTAHKGYFGGKPAPFEADRSIIAPDEGDEVLDRHAPLPPTKQQKMASVTEDILQNSIDHVVANETAVTPPAETVPSQPELLPYPGDATPPVVVPLPATPEDTQKPLQELPYLIPQGKTPVAQPTETPEPLPGLIAPSPLLPKTIVSRPSIDPGAVAKPEDTSNDKAFTVPAPAGPVEPNQTSVVSPTAPVTPELPQIKVEQVQPSMVLDLVLDFVSSKMAENTDPLTGLPIAPDKYAKEHEQLMDDIVTALQADKFKDNLPPDQLDALRSDLTALAAGVYQPDILTTYVDTMEIGKSPDVFSRLYQKAIGQELTRVYGKMYTPEQMKALVSLMAHISDTTLPGSVRADFVKTWQPILEPDLHQADPAPTTPDKPAPKSGEKQPSSPAPEQAVTKEDEIKLWTQILTEYISGLDNNTETFWQGHIDELARVGVEQYTKYGIPVAVGFAQLQAESNFNPSARSGVGAEGIAQMMPDTAKSLHIDPTNWRQSIEGQARYMGGLYDDVKREKAEGKIVGYPTPLALASYNAGNGNVLKYHRVPPFAETEHYIVRIQSFRKHFDKQYQEARRELLKSMQPTSAAPAPQPVPKTPSSEKPADPTPETPKRYKPEHEQSTPDKPLHETDTGVPLPDRIRGLRYFSQWDERWADVRYGTGDMKGSACGPTSMAIILSNLLGRDILPTEVAKFNLKHHLRIPHQGTDPSAVEQNGESYGVNVDDLNFNDESTIKAALDRGAYIEVLGQDGVAKTPATTAGHYYVITGYSDQGYEVLDPNSLYKSQTVYSYQDVFGPAAAAWSVSK